MTERDQTPAAGSRVTGLPVVARLCLIVPFLFALSLSGCAVMKNISLISGRPVQYVQEQEIERNDFSVARDDDVIGRPASITLEEGDTLPDIARHFSLGINEISAANPGVDIWVPKAGERVTLPLSHILPDALRKGIVINLAAMRIFQFREEGRSLAVSTYPVGVGSTERPSPVGQMYVQRKTVRPTWHVPASISEDHRKKGDPLPARVPPGPLNPLGEYALYLSRSTYLIHGTNKPASIGLNATNGCIRMYPEDVEKLYKSTRVNTPVRIVSQPYLVGRHHGIVYMEVHARPEESDPAELEKLYVTLRNIEKRSPRTLDWKKVRETLLKARGIPVSIMSRMDRGSTKGAAEAIEVSHPERLYGRPEEPVFTMDAWYVLAADLRDRIEAQRLAAIINHQGPQIPARVLSKGGKYRVIAGPFADIGEAGGVVKRLKIDLDIEGIVIEPAGKG
jgi:L,D-transpeptidase ErfK/SrfK